MKLTELVNKKNIYFDHNARMQGRNHMHISSEETQHI